MGFSLEGHSRGYDINIAEGLTCVVMGLSGAAYAKRHWELSLDKTESVWQHRLISVIQITPVIGMIAAIFEYVIVSAYNYFNSQKNLEIKEKRPDPIQLKIQQKDPLEPWKPRVFSIEEANKKMLKNARKAIEEHISKKKTEPYATAEECLPTLESLTTKSALPPLKFTAVNHHKQGWRQTMEDDDFHKEIKQGFLSAVFDGHGGDRVAKYACTAFADRFENELVLANNNVHQAFEKLFYDIQTEIIQKVDIQKLDSLGERIKSQEEEIAKLKKEITLNSYIFMKLVKINNEINKFNEEQEEISAYRLSGSTAIVNFIDKETHLSYTATLGDSEANIYRRIAGKMKSIPLSCIRDWSSSKDARRASHIMKQPEIAEQWPKAENPKFLRLNGRINVARSFGDIEQYHEGKPGVIHKPKITVTKVQPGDQLILACDGSKDFVSEQDVINEMEQYKGNNFAEHLVDFALDQRRSTDNVTVLVVDIA